MTKTKILGHEYCSGTIPILQGQKDIVQVFGKMNLSLMLNALKKLHSIFIVIAMELYHHNPYIHQNRFIINR